MIPEPLSIPIDSWAPRCTSELQQRIVSALESGAVVLAPRLDFTLADNEKRFLSPQWSDGRAKNVSFDITASRLAGAQGTPADLRELGKMLERFAVQAKTLVEGLIPGYKERLQIARTSFRPSRVEGRETTRRKDDSRLHVDAFPSRPTQGCRILRVFTNVNNGEARIWRVGERFDSFASRFLVRAGRPLPGSAGLLAALGVTKGKRSEYDFLMLRLHDLAKLDDQYQRVAPQLIISFPSRTSWLVFSDQVPHGAIKGQYVLEQTFHLPVSAMIDESKSPLRVLERLTGRSPLA